jgi:uncharacterized membrane protein YkoI
MGLRKGAKMKINKWIALALIALLVIGAMGLVSYRVFASSNLFQSQDCPDVEGDEANEAGEDEDADANECDEGGDANEAEESNGADSSDETAPAATGITAEEAQAIAEAANPGAATLFVEFDREGGKDLWEVELDNDLDVKVDANTGEILYSEQRD